MDNRSIFDEMYPELIAMLNLNELQLAPGMLQENFEQLIKFIIKENESSLSGEIPVSVLAQFDNSNTREHLSKFIKRKYARFRFVSGSSGGGGGGGGGASAALSRLRLDARREQEFRVQEALARLSRRAPALARVSSTSNTESYSSNEPANVGMLANVAEVAEVARTSQLPRSRSRGRSRGRSRSTTPRRRSPSRNR